MEDSLTRAGNHVP